MLKIIVRLFSAIVFLVYSISHTYSSSHALNTSAPAFVLMADIPRNVLPITSPP
jgi:hypothetical protein